MVRDSNVSLTAAQLRVVCRCSAKRLEVGVQGRDVLRFQPVERSFWHHREASERGSFDIATENAEVFRVRLAQHQRGGVLRNEQSVEHFAVTRLDAKPTVARLHRGVWRKNVTQQGLDAVRAGAVEHRANLPALTLNSVTDATVGCKELLASCQIASFARQ